MSVLIKLKYEQFLCILTLPKFIDQIYTIYRPEEKSGMVQTVQIELSINSNIKRSQI